MGEARWRTGCARWPTGPPARPVASVPEALADTTRRHAIAWAAHLTPLADLVPGSILQLTGAVMREALLKKVRTAILMIAVVLALAPLALRPGNAGFAEPPRGVEP